MAKDPPARDGNQRAAILTALASFGIGTLCYLFGILAPVDRAFLDLQTRAFEKLIDSDIVIVEIDARSLHELGAWPWPRSRHAELIKKLQHLGARRLFVDIDFSAPSTHPLDDQALAATLAHSPSLVVLPAFWQPLSSQDSSLILSEPLPILRQNPEVRIGSVNLVPGADGLVRQVPDLSALSSKSAPPVWATLDAVSPEAAGTPLMLDYRIAPESFAHVSYVDILDGRQRPDLAGKTILIGATAIELGDLVPVPVYRSLPRVVIQAIAYESAKRQRIAEVGASGSLLTLLSWALICAAWLRSVPWKLTPIAATGLLILIPVGCASLYAASGLILAPSAFLATWVASLSAALLGSLNLEARRTWRALLTVRHQDELLRQIIDTSTEGILTLDDRGSIRNANPAAAQMLNAAALELIGKPLKELCPRLQSTLDKLTPQQPLLTEAVELIHADGSLLPTEVVIKRLEWEESFVVSVSVRDVSAQLKREEELRHNATHDSLTGIPNRRLLAQRLQQALAENDAQHPFALLMLDLDDFKQVNDTLGYTTGDELLVALAERLQEFSAECSCVARIGGDEFALLLTQEQTANLDQVCEAVQRLVQAPITINGIPISLGTSIGVARYPADATEGELLLQRADIALSGAKRQHTSVKVYESSLDVSSPRRLQMLSLVRSALARNELALHFQPKVSLRSGAITEVEALCRWQSPVLGDVPTGEFIPLIEASDLIHPLTEWTLTHALQCCRRWRERGFDLKVAVNLSARHLQDAQLASWLKSLLSDTQTAPDRLELEITESAIMADAERALKTLGAISRLGVSLSIDDFGTGYSSLAYLQKLAVNRLKIDKSFVSGLTVGHHDELIVKSTIDLAHGLALDVISEGIETAGQYNMLRRMGCDFGQGFFIARPMSEDLLLNWLASQGDGSRFFSPEQATQPSLLAEGW